MKRLNYFLLCLLTASISLALVISSCSKEESPEENHIPMTNLAAFTLPEQTTVDTSGNGINYSLPDGYKAYGVDEKGNYLSFSHGRISCACAGGDEGGCNLKTTDRLVACLSAGCTNCAFKRTTRTDGFDLELEEVVIFDMNTPVKRVNSVKDLEGKIMLPGQFAKLDIIQNEIQKIEKEAARCAGERTKIAPVILYGYVVMLELPEAYGLSSISSVYYLCKCTKGLGWCRKTFEGTFITCESRCKACTITATLKDEDFDGKEYVIETVNHHISFL